MGARDRRYWERRRVEQEERSELWRKIEAANTPEEVVEIMAGQYYHYGWMSTDQYNQPGHSKLMDARLRCWDDFWSALYTRHRGER